MANRQSLRELAGQYAVPLVNYVHPIQLRNNLHSPEYRVSDLDKKAAELLLLARRAADPQYKPPSSLKRTFSRSKSAGASIFDPNEINRGLDAAVMSEVPIGVVKALLLLGGNVNIARMPSRGLVRKLSGMGQLVERGDLMSRAAAFCSLGLLELLAGEADQISLDEALGAALNRADLRVVKLLLEFGANLETHHKEFQSIVQNKAEDMAEILLMAPKPPCQSCHDSMLEVAVNIKSQRILSLLAFTKANADYQHAKALRDAIFTNNRACALTILLSCQPPSAQSLDMVLSEVYGKIENGEPENRVTELIQILLCGGAVGPCTAEVLLKAVQKTQTLLVQTLLDHGVSVDHKNGAAIQFAVASGQESMVDRLLSARPNATSLYNSMQSTRFIKSIEKAHSITKMLITAGARGNAVTDAMIFVVERLPKLSTEDDRKLSHDLLRTLLFEGEANVNSNGGKAVQLSMSAGDMETFQILLNEKLSTSTLNSSFPVAMALEDKDASFQMIRALLNAGATGDVVDEALINSIAQGLSGSKLTLALLKYASVDYKNGKALKTAIVGYHTRALELILEKGPSDISLDSSMGEAKKLSGSKRRTVIVLMIEKGLTQDSLNAALLDAVRETTPDKILIQMYLKAGASSDFNDGACIIHAAKVFDADVLRMLSHNIITTKVFSSAFDEVARSHIQWFTPEHLPVIKILLEKGAEGSGVVNSVCWAACTSRLEVLQALAESMPWNPSVFTLAFSQAVQANNRWLSKEGLDIILVLLHHGASGEQVDIALVQAVRAHCSGQHNENLIKTLFEFKADVNYGQGEALQLATEHGDNKLLEKLVNQGATSDSISRALFTGIVAQHEEPCLLEMLAVMVENSVNFNINLICPEMDPPIYLCLKFYPNSAALCQRFCELGANLETKVSCQVYPGEMSEFGRELEPEEVSALTWALAQPNMKIGTEVIMSLIDNDADINFITKTSRTTPLILAAKNKRLEVLTRLLNSNAKSNLKDLHDRSALFYASRHGYAIAVGHLLKERQKHLNDGSLHEAARGFHVPVIELLTHAGHHPNFNSVKHEGRTALGELARRGICPADTSLVQDSIDSLLAAKADPLKRSNGKSTIFQALDNIDPTPITELLLDRVLWEDLNSEANIYKEGDYYYSPTMYVTKGVLLGPYPERSRLHQLLKAHQAEDRFYATMGLEQPPDAVGLPEEIKEFERSRQKREENYAERERKRTELEEDHVDLQRRQSESVTLKMQLLQAEHDQKLHHGDDVAAQRQHHRQVDHDMNMRFRTEDDALTKQIRFTDASQLEAITYRQARAQEYEGQRARELALQESRRTHQEKLLQFRSTADEALQLAARQNSMELQKQRDREQVTLRMQSGQNKLAIEQDAARTRQMRLREDDSVRAAGARHRMTTEELLMRQRTAVGMFQMEQIRAGTGGQRKRGPRRVDYHIKERGPRQKMLTAG